MTNTRYLTEIYSYWESNRIIIFSLYSSQPPASLAHDSLLHLPANNIGPTLLTLYCFVSCLSVFHSSTIRALVITQWVWLTQCAGHMLVGCIQLANLISPATLILAPCQPNTLMGTRAPGPMDSFGHHSSHHRQGRTEVKFPILGNRWFQDGGGRPRLEALSEPSAKVRQLLPSIPRGGHESTFL